MNAIHRFTSVPRHLRLFLGLFIVLGLVAVGAGLVNLVRGFRCESWPTVEGVIVSADMNSNTDNDGATSYSASIAYVYQVAGRHYDGDRLAFGAISASASHAQKVLDRFPVGKKVPVYYSPGDPQLAVLETGIHGGTWICFGVGTLFVLAGMMFLQVFSAASRASRNLAFAPAASGGVQGQRPPVLMGVIFILMGSFVFFEEPAAGVPNWIGYAAGGMFVLAGLCLLATRLANPLYAKILGGTAVLALLVIFHWVSFGLGGRMGTTTTPFSQHIGVNVKTPFAVFTTIMDLVILAVLARRLTKGRKD